eukprot:snap_masked-scaffold_19-processed-gene-1.26-mRNA-1 protein AED:1.00 eAED:1.00 QI:0/-1/0/0/-1/1/1/0/82
MGNSIRKKKETFVMKAALSEREMFCITRGNMIILWPTTGESEGNLKEIINLYLYHMNTALITDIKKGIQNSKYEYLCELSQS